MSSDNFKITCNNCGEGIYLDDHDKPKKIRLDSAVSIKLFITITCQNCGNSVHLK